MNSGLTRHARSSAPSAPGRSCSRSSGSSQTSPACTDSATKPWVEEAGVRVLDQPFVAHGNIATAGGCLACHYLAAWVIAHLAGWNAAESVLHYVAPVGQKQEYVERARAVTQHQLPQHERVTV